MSKNNTMKTDYSLPGKHSALPTINPVAALTRQLLHYYDRNAKPIPSDGGSSQVTFCYNLGSYSWTSVMSTYFIVFFSSKTCILDISNRAHFLDMIGSSWKGVSIKQHAGCGY